MTKHNIIQTHAYGSCMLMGEHSVLFNYLAVCTSLKQQVSVELSPRQDNQVTIRSVFGDYQASIHALAEDKQLTFVIRTVQEFKQQYLSNASQGFDLVICSDIEQEKGFGSSAAVVVALSQSLFIWQELSVTEQQRWQFCRQVIQTVQGSGSGADACASIYGGVCVYSQQQGFIKRLDLQWLNQLGWDWQLVYCGYKTPTAEVLQYVAQQQRTTTTEKYQHIYANMGKQTLKFIEACEQQDSQSLIDAVNSYHQLMVALGVSDETIETIVQQAMKQTHAIQAAKISGSGLGDCVLVLSNSPNPPAFNGYQRFAIPFFNTHGVIE